MPLIFTTEAKNRWSLTSLPHTPQCSGASLRTRTTLPYLRSGRNRKLPRNMSRYYGSTVSNRPLTTVVAMLHGTLVVSLDITVTRETSRLARAVCVYKHVSVGQSVRSHSKEETCKHAKHQYVRSRLWTALFHLMDRGSDRQRIYPHHSMKWKDVMTHTNTHAAGRFRNLDFSNQHYQYYHIRVPDHWPLSQQRSPHSAAAK